MCRPYWKKYQFTPKGGGKKFQVLPKGDEKKHKTTTRSGKSVYLQAVTMIDPAACWIEIRTVLSAQADLVVNKVELTWLTLYPLPSKVVVVRGNEFLAKFREIIINDYGITVKPITSRNPQANVILEQIH